MKSSMLLAALAATALSAMAVAALAEDNGAPAGPNKEVFDAKCSTCHGVGRVLIYHRTREGWAGTVDQMMDKGLVASPEEVDKIVTYLSTALGPLPADPAPSAATPAATPAP